MEQGNTKIRLLILIDTNVGGVGGAERHLKQLVENFDSARFQIDVVQLQLELDKEAPVVNGKLGEAKLYHLPIGRLISIHGVRQLFKLFKMAKVQQYTCILSFFETSDIIAVLLGYLTGIQALISSRRDTGFRYTRKIEWVYRHINHRFTRLVAPSVAVNKSLLAAGVDAKKVRCIHNGVDTSRFSGINENKLREDLGIPIEAVVLGVVANLRPVKNHTTLIDALSIIHEGTQCIYLVIAGDGPLLTKLQSEVKSKGLTKYVHFLGRRDDIPNIVGGIDIFVLPSLTEGLSNAILEAMAASKPVVATSVGGNPELVDEGKTGLLCNAGNSKELVNALNRMMSAPELRARMGNAGRKKVEKDFGIKTMVDAYMSVISDVVSQSTPTATSRARR